MPEQAPAALSGNFVPLLLGLFAGTMVACAAAMARSARATVGWTCILFSLTSALYAAKLWNYYTQALPDGVVLIISVLSITSIGWFWLFVMALFGDRNRMRGSALAAPAMLAIMPMICWTAPASLLPWLEALTTIMHLGLSIHALAIVLRGWKGDLIETRRRIRGPFLVAVPVYMIFVSVIEFWRMSQPMPGWYPVTSALALCALGVLGAFVFLDPRADLFGSITPQRLPSRAAGGAPISPAAPVSQLAAAQLDRAVRADLDRLDGLMRRDQVWREEGLTIASLAVRLSIPEAHLRRLINDRLGHRNFPSFVNAHRIGSAKARLADPAEARTPISTVAYDVGFASLGPFNRAFREETGLAPSEWRRQALSGDDDAGDASPIPDAV
jgi:AraC-like DNA-binding protein